MLQKMRSGVQSTLVKGLLFGLLLLAMLGLAFTDVQGMFRGGSSTSGAVAKIDGKKISAAEFDAVFQRSLRQQNISSDDALRNALPLLVLNQEINSRIYAQSAYDLGLIIDDKTAATALKNDVLGPIAKEAGISEKEALARLLANLNLRERAFIETFKSQMATDALLATIPAGARAPEQMVTDALKRRYEWRRGEYFELTAADLGNALKPANDAELKKHYAAISSDFLLPEYRSFEVLVINRANLGLDGKPASDAVEAYYTEHKDEFATGERRTIEQLITADETIAKEMVAQAKSGQTLKALATAAKASSDPVRSKVVFTASTYSEEDLDVDLARAAFDAPANALVGPVKTPLGWHVMKIISVAAAHTPPLSEVRTRIEQDMADDINSEALYARASEIDDMVAGGASLSDVARQYKLKVSRFTDVTSEGLDKSGKKPGSALPAMEKIVETAYTLDEGRTSPLTETSDGGLLLITTTAITKAQEQPFTAVRAEVAESLRLKKLGALFDAKSTEITEKIQLGESFASVAKILGKRVDSTGLLQRAATPAQAGIARGVLPALFALEKIGQTTAVNGEEKITILRLAERKIAPPKDIKKQDMQALRATLDRAVKNDILEQYRAYLLDKYNVTVNEELLGRMYTRRSASEDNL